MKKVFVAVFSSGRVLRRTSEHDYKTAWISTDYAKTPPAVIGLGFSTNLNLPGEKYSYGGLHYMSANERAKHKKLLALKNASVRTEVVRVSQEK